jgi:hypothetical protein
VDAIGGTSPEAHRAGLDRVMQAGAQPVSWVSLAVELQRDWNRQGTAQAVIEIVLTGRLGPYLSPAASYLFSAAYEPAEALPVASPEPSPT